MVSDKQKTIIKFDKVCFGYEPNKLIINNISFEILDNDFIAVIGSNASGKTTLAKLMVGLVKPTTGSIYFQNQLITKDNYKILKDNVGIVFQNPDSQLIGFSPEDDIAFGLENKQVEQNKMHDIVSTISNIVDIKDILYVDASKLSGGQKQKVAIASILALNPKIIIFDESTSMLDYTSKLSLVKLMKQLKTQHHKTIVWITHDMNDTIDADRVLVLHKGILYGYDRPEVIFNKKIESIGLSKPFALTLSKKIKGIKPSIKLDEVIKEIKNEK